MFLEISFDLATISYCEKSCLIASFVPLPGTVLIDICVAARTQKPTIVKLSYELSELQIL